MRTIGDETAGFSTTFDSETFAVRVRGWGFWSTTVAEAFAEAVREVCSASPRGAALLMDMTDLKPLREEGQRSFGALISLLPKLGVGRTAVATSSHLTKLQLLRLVAERGARESVQFTALEADPSRAFATNTQGNERTSR